MSGRPFQSGDRVASYLLREKSGEVTRRDVLAEEEAGFSTDGFVFCRWVHAFKPKPAEENRDRLLKMTAENLFVTLADPAAEPSEANTPLIQFLALMLERKRVLKPRGLTEDGVRRVYEHAKSHQFYEVPTGTFDETFFASIQEQLGVLVGGGEKEAVSP